ncbi:basic proline-rich protein-like [Lathamus discolor]|uniref:basic proline-rich protein-like n=1 Tax=Lathamus discolor TaxID=678569 RepID=UPI0032B7EC1A
MACPPARTRPPADPRHRRQGCRGPPASDHPNCPSIRGHGARPRTGRAEGHRHRLPPPLPARPPERHLPGTKRVGRVPAQPLAGSSACPGARWGVDKQLPGHGGDAGSRAGANTPVQTGRAPPGSSRGGVTTGRRRRRRGSAGSRGLPPAAALPGEISPRFHHPPPAPEEKFLLRARGSGRPSRAGERGALLAPHPSLRPRGPPPPCPGPSCSCHVCTEGARHQLAEPRCRGLGLSTTALPPRAWAQARAGGLGGPPGPAIDVPSRPPRSPPCARSPALRPCPHFPFSTHPLQVPEPNPSLGAQHRHHHRGLELPAAAVCQCQGTPAPSPHPSLAMAGTQTHQGSPQVKPGTESTRLAKATLGQGRPWPKTVALHRRGPQQEGKYRTPPRANSRLGGDQHSSSVCAGQSPPVLGGCHQGTGPGGHPCGGPSPTASSQAPTTAASTAGPAGHRHGAGCQDTETPTLRSHLYRHRRSGADSRAASVPHRCCRCPVHMGMQPSCSSGQEGRGDGGSTRSPMGPVRRDREDATRGRPPPHGRRDPRLQRGAAAGSGQELRTPPAASRPHATHRNRAAIKRSPHRQRYRSVVVRAAPAAPLRSAPTRAAHLRAPPELRDGPGAAAPPPPSPAAAAPRPRPPPPPPPLPPGLQEAPAPLRSLGSAPAVRPPIGGGGRPSAPPHPPRGGRGPRGLPPGNGERWGGTWEELSQSRGTAAITGPGPGTGGGAAAPAPPPAPRPVPGAEPRCRPAPLRSAPQARGAGNRAPGCVRGDPGTRNRAPEEAGGGGGGGGDPGTERGQRGARGAAGPPPLPAALGRARRQRPPPPPERPLRRARPLPGAGGKCEEPEPEPPPRAAKANTAPRRRYVSRAGGPRRGHRSITGLPPELPARQGPVPGTCRRASGRGFARRCPPASPHPPPPLHPRPARTRTHPPGPGLPQRGAGEKPAENALRPPGPAAPGVPRPRRSPQPLPELSVFPRGPPPAAPQGSRTHLLPAGRGGAGAGRGPRARVSRAGGVAGRTGRSSRPGRGRLQRALPVPEPSPAGGERGPARHGRARGHERGLWCRWHRLFGL